MSARANVVYGYLASKPAIAEPRTLAEKRADTEAAKQHRYIINARAGVVFPGCNIREEPRAANYDSPILRITERKDLSESQIYFRLKELDRLAVEEGKEKARRIARSKRAVSAVREKRSVAERKRKRRRPGAPGTPHIRKKPATPIVGTPAKNAAARLGIAVGSPAPSSRS